MSAAIKVVFLLNTMLTKEEKKQAVALGEEIIGKSKNILFADFTSVPTAEVRKLRI